MNSERMTIHDISYPYETKQLNISDEVASKILELLGLDGNRVTCVTLDWEGVSFAVQISDYALEYEKELTNESL